MADRPRDGSGLLAGRIARIPPPARSSHRYIRGLLQIGGRHGAIAGAAASTRLPRFGSRACQHPRCHRARGRPGLRRHCAGRSKRAISARLFSFPCRSGRNFPTGRIVCRLDSPRPCLYIASHQPKRGALRGNAQVAQLVEHATENRSVGGSIPPLGTISLFCCSAANVLRTGRFRRICAFWCLDVRRHPMIPWDRDARIGPAVFIGTEVVSFLLVFYVCSRLRAGALCRVRDDILYSWVGVKGHHVVRWG